MRSPTRSAQGGGSPWVVGVLDRDVVPRSWTHLLAVLTGQPLDPRTPTPEGWQDLVRARTGETPPTLMTDGADASYDAWDAGLGDSDDPVDRAIAAARLAAFPEHGLDPYDVR